MEQLRKIRNQYQNLHGMKKLADNLGIDLPLNALIAKNQELEKEAIKLNFSPDIITLEDEAFEMVIRKPDFLKSYQICENN